MLVTGLPTRLQILAEAEFFFSATLFRLALLGADQQRVQWSKHETDHLCPSNAMLKKVQSFTYTFLHSTWGHFFTFTLQVSLKMDDSTKKLMWPMEQPDNSEMYELPQKVTRLIHSPHCCIMLEKEIKKDNRVWILGFNNFAYLPNTYFILFGLSKLWKYLFLRDKESQTTNMQVCSRWTFCKLTRNFNDSSCCFLFLNETHLKWFITTV